MERSQRSRYKPFMQLMNVIPSRPEWVSPKRELIYRVYAPLVRGAACVCASQPFFPGSVLAQIPLTLPEASKSAREGPVPRLGPTYRLLAACRWGLLGYHCVQESARMGIAGSIGGRGGGGGKRTSQRLMQAKPVFVAPARSSVYFPLGQATGSR